MAIAMALPGFKALRCLVTPILLSRNQFHLQLSPHCPEMNKESMWEVKIFQNFCPREIESWHLAAVRHMKLCSLNLIKCDLLLKEPLLEFPYHVLVISLLVYSLRRLVGRISICLYVTVSCC